MKRDQDGEFAELWRRADAFSDAVAALALLDREVREFRDGALEGRLLSEEDARRFCRNPVLGMVRRDQLQEWGVGLFDAWAENIAESRNWNVESGEGLIKAEIRFPSGVTGAAQLYRRSEIRETGPDYGNESLANESIAFPGETGVDHRAVWPGSVLAEVRKVAHPLTSRYPWEDYQAVWFLLTGLRPGISPYRTNREMFNPDGPVFYNLGLEVAPWASPDDVQRLYRRLQATTLQSVRKRDQALGDGSLAVFRFVLSHAPQLLRPSLDAQGKTWGSLCYQWNNDPSTPEEWRYRTKRGGEEVDDAGGFWRAFDRWRELLFPTLRQAVLEDY